LLAGAADRLLPSLSEAEHLVKVLPNAEMVVLPHSGHACLLEREVNLYEIIKDRKFLAGRDKVSTLNHQPVSSTV
jgi:pimeloyl-ACP methyl ester carboxylesterase